MQKTALITGASSGIGRALAREFAGAGYRLILVARGREKLLELKEELEKAAGAQALVIPKDLCAESAADELYLALQEQGVEVDVLINNAGFGDYAAFLDADFTKQRRMVELNILAVMHMTHVFGNAMRARGQGRILNIASVAAFFPGPYMSIYYASKAFVLSFSEAVAEELKGTGVTVTAFCPGPVETNFEAAADMIDSHMFATIKPVSPESVARACYRAVEKRKTVKLYTIRVKVMSFASRLGPRAVNRKGAKFVNGVPREARRG